MLLFCMCDRICNSPKQLQIFQIPFMYCKCMLEQSFNFMCSKVLGVVTPDRSICAVSIWKTNYWKL